MNFSPYQSAILEEIPRPGRRHVCIIARAGSGKTFTIVEACKRLPRHLKALYVPFNKAVADEGKIKLAACPNIEVRTLNAFGRQLIVNDRKLMQGRRLGLDFKKNETILKTLLAPEDFSAWGRYFTPVLDRAVCLAKDMMYTSNNTVDEFNELFEDFDLVADEYIAENVNTAEFIHAHWETFTSPLITDKQVITDFADQLYLPFKHQIVPPVYAWCFVDEAQDLSPIQWDLIFRMSKYTNICFVGDPMQTIYEFRGADHLSMEAAIERLDAKTFKLPICYRCPTKVIKLAQEYTPDIEPCETAPEGEVERITPEKFYHDVIPSHAVLARTNAELIMVAHSLRFKYNKPCYIKGDGALKSIKKIVKKAKLSRHHEAAAVLQLVNEHLQERLAQSKNGRIPPIVLAAFQAIKATMERFDNWGDAEDFLNSIFPDKFDGTNAIILTTIHKFKGREARRVYYLNYISPTPDAIPEELRIAYVGVTRAAHELFFVQVGSPFKKNEN